MRAVYKGILILALFMVIPFAASAATVLGLTATPDNGDAPLAVSFATSTTGCVNGTGWNLSFGDGEYATPNGGTYLHTYDDPGTYDAVMGITCDDGYQHIHEIVTVTDARGIWVPIGDLIDGLVGFFPSMVNLILGFAPIIIVISVVTFVVGYLDRILAAIKL